MGCHPIWRNLIRALQRRGKKSRMELLKCMLDELSGDHAQSLQLATMAQQLMSDDTEKTTSSEVNHSAIMSMVVSDKILGAKVVKKSLTYTGNEVSLLKLKNIVQTLMNCAVSSTYGQFASPNSPIISNTGVLGLVKQYIELMPVHHASILIMLNVEKR